MAEGFLEALAKGLDDAGVDALLIGGHALQALGVARQTLDIDLLIAETDDAGLARVVRELGCEEAARTENFVRYANRDARGLDVDVLFVDPATFAKMKAEASEYRTGEGAYAIPSVAHFVALKLHAITNNARREARDLADVVEVLRRNPDSVSEAELEEIGRRYGPEGVYSKLKRLL